MRRGFIPLLAVLAAGCGGGGPTPPAGTTPGKVELTAVTTGELDAAIASHKGKVVYVDCWFLG